MTNSDILPFDFQTLWMAFRRPGRLAYKILNWHQIDRRQKNVTSVDLKKQNF